MNQTELQAARALLEKGIKVPVTAPLLLRAFGKRRAAMTIRAPKLGTLIRISELFLKTGLTEDDISGLDDMNVHLLYAAHCRTFAEIAAQAALNGKWSGRIFGRYLANRLLWRLTAVQLLNLLNVVVSLNGSLAFTNTIRLAVTMKVTAPTLSQPAEES